MSWWDDLLDTFAAIDLTPILTWPWWPQTGLAVSLLFAGGLVGWFVGRRRRVDLGAEEVLTALERVVRRDLSGAFRILEDATHSAEAPPELYFALASLLRAMGHADRSAQLHRALTLRPGLDKLLQTRAVIGLAGDFLTLGRNEEAENLLGELPRHIRRQDALLALRRNAALRAEDWKEALSAGGLLARRTGDEGDGVSEIYSRMASAALKRGDENEAIRNFKRALSSSRHNVHASEGLARIYVSQEKFFRARQLVDKALTENGHIAPRILPLMRAALRSRTKYHRYLDKLAESHVASPWVELELAEIAYSEEDFNAASDILGDLVERYPRSLDVREAWLNLLIAIADERTIFVEMDRFVALSKESLARFRCSACTHTAPYTFVSCPRCGAHGTVGYLPEVTSLAA